MSWIALARSGAADRPLADAFAALRQRLGLIVLLLAVSAGAWWWSARQMSGMDAGPTADLGTIGWFAGIWLAMMAAMMFPSVAPTVALYAHMTRRRGIVRPLLFAAGYLLVWGVAGLAVYGAIRLGRGAAGERLAWHHEGRWLAGGVLAAAAIYEVLPLKDLCLTRCRSPLAFLLGTWSDGRLGPLKMGSRHAVWCLGCCWALMGALFALGVMSLVRMAFVAALIAVEKLLPWRRLATGGTAVVLLALAVGVVLAPDSVPGLVVPHGGQAMVGGMQAMGR